MAIVCGTPVKSDSTYQSAVRYLATNRRDLRLEISQRPMEQRGIAFAATAL
jgi:hypothetical protein